MSGPGGAAMRRRRGLFLLMAVFLLLSTIGVALGLVMARRRGPAALPSPTAQPATIGAITSPAAEAGGTPVPAPVVVVNTPIPAPVYVPLVAGDYTPLPCLRDTPGGLLDAPPVQWQPLTLAFDGPSADAGASTNPFLDYRLQVMFLSPSGRVSVVPGYFAGNDGDGRRAVWRAHFAADEPGLWRYCASFRAGPDVAVDLDPTAGQPAAFDGASAAFQVAGTDPDAPDFFRWGRLEYVGGHYLKFRDGPYWLKGGTNSPENFLGYAGFRNTIDQGGIIEGFLHTFSPHVTDGRSDDPSFTNDSVAPGDPTMPAASGGIIGALNYLGEQHVNSIYFLPLNLGGDGQDTYPYLSPADHTHFDVGKLDQWGIVLEHAQRRGIALHIVLNEVEESNRRLLDGGALGRERKLFYREMVARFGHLPAIKWNLSEEVAFSFEEMRAFAGYLDAQDWADHPITVHNSVGAVEAVYGGLGGDRLFSATAMQYAAEEAGRLVESWRATSAAAGRPWIIDMDENNPAGVGLTPDNAGQLRKAILYDVYFSGGAGLEWYLGYHDLPLGGDVNLEDFRTRERMWDYMWYARRFMEENLPFHLMSPADDLLSGETEAFGGGEVFALPGHLYAVYLPAATPAGVLAVPAGSYQWRWYDPRTGEFAGEPLTAATEDNGLPLGNPPALPDGDWVVLVTRLDAPRPTPTVAFTYP